MISPAFIEAGRFTQLDEADCETTECAFAGSKMSPPASTVSPSSSLISTRSPQTPNKRAHGLFLQQCCLCALLRPCSDSGLASSPKDLNVNRNGTSSSPHPPTSHSTSLDTRDYRRAASRKPNNWFSSLFSRDCKQPHRRTESTSLMV